MFSPRWKKVIADLRNAKGRWIMMVTAIAVGIFGIASMLSSYSILTRELNLNYMSTNPASAYIELESVDLKNSDKNLLEKVRKQPGIEGVEATAWVNARIEMQPNEWQEIMLFGIDDFENMNIGTFEPESGVSPPPDGSILLERSALIFLEANIGDTLYIKTSTGEKKQISISGTVHDPSLPPAEQDQRAFGYISESTLQQLGETESFHILKVLFQDQTMNIAKIEQNVGKLAEWMQQQGIAIEEIRIPPPGQHPHQSQLTSIVIMLLLFSLMALILSAILIATMINGMLAGQIHQIGVMKAIGASTKQIAGIYLLMVVVLSIIAVLIGLPAGITFGRLFAEMIAVILNFTIYSDVLPLWNYIVLLLTGILIPVLTALIPILRVTRITVRETLSEYGVSRKSLSTSRLETFLGKIKGLDRTLILSLRNTFRKKGRLILTICLLSVAGSMFLTGLNVKAGWEKIISDAASQRHYDLEIKLNDAEPRQRMKQILEDIPGVEKVEVWNIEEAARVRSDGLNIVQTYPDGGHGSFSLRSVPINSSMIDLPLIKGSWLDEIENNNAIVLNHNAKTLFPDLHVGDSLPLLIRGNSVQFEVVGIVREDLAKNTVYISSEGYGEVTGQLEQSNKLRVALKDPESIAAMKNELEKVLAKENINVESIISEIMLAEALTGHISLLIFALIMMSMIMAVVGGLGLISSMSTNIIERTREFGIIRTIGGRTGTILRNVVSEGIFIGIISWIIALPISLPLSASIGKLIGNMTFNVPLPLILSPMAIFIWLIFILLGSTAASFYPAWKASQLTIRNTLDYV
ncbi:ABC transporter permease [Chengkuizengella sp. SCS-71B]|uniref:ABC transporter permease n=1 Tax=Chengkuizengella sp. SCS-71B TaxID=3115290 RepID=UPI0032C22916